MSLTTSLVGKIWSAVNASPDRLAWRSSPVKSNTKRVLLQRSRKVDPLPLSRMMHPTLRPRRQGLVPQTSLEASSCSRSNDVGIGQGAEQSGPRGIRAISVQSK